MQDGEKTAILVSICKKDRAELVMRVLYAYGLQARARVKAYGVGR
jgi:hypothetical protein